MKAITSSLASLLIAAALGGCSGGGESTTTGTDSTAVPSAPTSTFNALAIPPLLTGTTVNGTTTFDLTLEPRQNNS